MAEGWKQIWDDIVGALRGQPRPEAAPEAPTQPEAVPAPGTEDSAPAADGAPGDPAATAPTTSIGELEKTAPAALEPLIPPDLSAGQPAEAATTEGVTVDRTVGPETSPAIADAADPDAAQAPELTPRERRLERLRSGALMAGLAAVLLVGLWFSGGYRWWPPAYLWWLRLTAPRPPASDVIATFDGGQLTIADVEAHLQVLAPPEHQADARSPDIIFAVVEDMITDELVRRWAAGRQPDADEDFRHTMEHITEDLNLEALDLQRHEGEIQIDESELRAYFEANPDQFGEQPFEVVREQIRELLIAEQEQGYIEDYIARLKENASITRNYELLDVPAPTEEELRQEYEAKLEQFQLPRQVRIDELQFAIGSDEAAARRAADDALLKIRSGASFGEASQVITGTVALTDTLSFEGVRDPAWDTAVFGLTVGELSDVFRAGEAFYIVRLNALEPARTQSLDEVRPTVLAAAQQTKTDAWFAANASKTLFTLKGNQYSLGQFYTEYQELPVFTQSEYAGPEGMRALAEQLIERLLLVEDTYDQLLDVQNKPLVDEARLQVLKQMLHQEEVDDQLEVSDEELQQFYDANLDMMTLPPNARIRYIRIGLGASEEEATAARARADEAYRKLVPGLFLQGEAFATVAQAYSEDPETAANGGELDGWIGESDDILAEAQIHPFHEAVLALQPDEISPPFELGDSLYIVQVIERTAPEVFTFEQAKPYIEEILTQQQHEDRLAQLSDELFQQANVVIYETVLADYFGQLQTPVTPE